MQYSPSLTSTSKIKSPSVEGDVPLDLDAAAALVKDLQTPSPLIYWKDLLLTSLIGWGAWIAANQVTFGSIAMIIWVCIAALSLYRALIFVHELSHLRKGELPGFSLVWNLIIGIPLLFPTFIYLGMHSDHHRLGSYGTPQDPEYLPLAGKPVAILGFIAQSFVLPLLLLVRFIGLSPVGLIFPKFHRILETYASSLAMNPKYCRKITDAERVPMKRLEGVIFIIWGSVITLAYLNVISWKIFLVWYYVMAMICVVNSLRTLVAHRYRSEGQATDRTGQFLDSIDTPSGLLTGIWAPTGLRYHALHHLFPNIPYHNLAEAYERLTSEQHESSSPTYSTDVNPSWLSSFRGVWAKRPNSV